LYTSSLVDPLNWEHCLTGIGYLIDVRRNVQQIYAVSSSVRFLEIVADNVVFCAGNAGRLEGWSATLVLSFLAVSRQWHS
jgi:hypothetical protein